MNKYSRGQIYKIISIHTDIFYIGSTIQPLYKRLNGHKTDYNKNKYCSSQEILKLGDYKIILICKYPCNDKVELSREEQRHIDMYDKEILANCKRAHITPEQKKIQLGECIKKYVKKNKEHLKEYRKEYNKQNKEHRKEYNKKNKEHRKEYNKKNKEHIKEHKKEYNKQNKEHIKEHKKEYNKKNKEHIAGCMKYKTFIFGLLVDVF